MSKQERSDCIRTDRRWPKLDFRVRPDAVARRRGRNRTEEMTPTVYTKMADRLFPFRWWLLAASVCSALLIIALASLYRAPATLLLAGPIVGLSWAALCAATWFHPTHGKIQSGAKRFGRLPIFVQIIVRWYAAIFLGIFVVFCGVLPLFAFSAFR